MFYTAKQLEDKVNSDFNDLVNNYPKLRDFYAGCKENYDNIDIDKFDTIYRSRALAFMRLFAGADIKYQSATYDTDWTIVVLFSDGRNCGVSLDLTIENNDTVHLYFYQGNEVKSMRYAYLEDALVFFKRLTAYERGNKTVQLFTALRNALQSREH